MNDTGPVLAGGSLGKESIGADTVTGARISHHDNTMDADLVIDATGPAARTRAYLRHRS